MKTKPGVIRDLSRADYDAIEAESVTKLKRLLKSPAHYRHGQDDDTQALKFGRVVHLATLEPARMETDVAVWGLEVDQKVRRGKVWDEFEAKHAGQEIVTVAEFEAAVAIARAVRADPHAGPFVNGGEAEVSILWDVDGMPMKSRLDYVIDRPDFGALVDLKKVQDASPEGFERALWSYRWDGQAAAYQHAYAHATGRWLPFYFVAAEEKAPHVCQVYRMPPPMLEAGWALMTRLVEQLRFCRATDAWPGYHSGVLEASLPARAWAQLEQEGVGDGW